MTLTHENIVIVRLTAGEMHKIIIIIIIIVIIDPTLCIYLGPWFSNCLHSCNFSKWTFGIWKKIQLFARLKCISNQQQQTNRARRILKMISWWDRYKAAALES